MSTGLRSDEVFISELLPRRYPALAEQLAAVLPRRPSLIRGTRDIWCRDYMPVPASTGRLVQFRYRPDYLRGRPELRTKIDPAKFPLTHCRHCHLVIDGGNVQRLGNTAIVTDKVYRENPRLKRAHVRQRLADVPEVDHLIVIPAEPGDLLGHADGVLRFIDEHTVLVNDYRRVNPDYGQRLQRIRQRQGLRIVPCPYAPTSAVDAECIPSAAGVYVNALVTRDVVAWPALRGCGHAAAADIPWQPRGISAALSTVIGGGDDRPVIERPDLGAQ